MTLEVQEGEKVEQSAAGDNRRPHQRASTRVAPTMLRIKRLTRLVHSRGDPRGRPLGTMQRGSLFSLFRLPYPSDARSPNSAQFAPGFFLSSLEPVSRRR